MSDRIEELKQELSKNTLDALFITDQYNVSYLTRFSGLSKNEREGFLFVTQNNAYLLTFPTYFGLYKDLGVNFEVLNITLNKKLHHHLKEIIVKEKVCRIGVEEENLTISEFASLKKKLKTRFKKTKGLVENLRLLKAQSEIAAIRRAAEITDQAFELIKQKIKKGLSEKDLSLEIEFFFKKHAEDIAFSPIVAFNQNAAIPHYLPSNNYRLTNNSLILLDFGAKIKGYCSDMTRVLFFGKPKSKLVEAYHSVLKAQKLALNKLKAGEKCARIDNITRQFLISKGYPEYQHGLGHGVGLAIHEAPRLKIDSKEILQENMVVTVEPGIYLEGKYGIRIEDLVVLRKDGVEILSKSTKELTIINNK